MANWKVTFIFSRNNVEERIYEGDTKASEAVRIALFNNKDAVQCFIYKIPDENN